MRGIAATSCMLMGCLITDDIEFPEEPVCPPAISTPVGADNPLNEIARAAIGMAGGEDAGVGMREETFDVQVWDCNVDQELSWVVLVNARPDFGDELGDIQKSGTVEPTASAERTFAFSFSEPELTVSLGEGCHKIELFVSSGFRNFIEPAEPGDLGTATWWMIVDDQATMTEDPSCR